MQIVSFASVKGGTGRTTIAAHLGSILAQETGRCLVVDADPQNSLGHWMGMEKGERFGLIRQGISASDLTHFTRRSRSEVPYLPFGSFDPIELYQAENFLRQDPLWLQNRIQDLARAEYDLVLIDTPAGYSPWTVQALTISDRVIVPLLPDSASYATVPETQLLIDATSNGRVQSSRKIFLVNQMDARFELARDVKSALLNLAPEEVLPMALPFDQSVREAQAQQQTLFHRFPDSQVIVNLKQVVEVLLASLENDEQ